MAHTRLTSKTYSPDSEPLSSYIMRVDYIRMYFIRKTARKKSNNNKKIK